MTTLFYLHWGAITQIIKISKSTAQGVSGKAEAISASGVPTTKLAKATVASIKASARVGSRKASGRTATASGNAGKC